MADQVPNETECKDSGWDPTKVFFSVAIGAATFAAAALLLPRMEVSEARIGFSIAIGAAIAAGVLHVMRLLEVPKLR